jgi:hypothetical protein
VVHSGSRRKLCGLGTGAIVLGATALERMGWAAIHHPRGGRGVSAVVLPVRLEGFEKMNIKPTHGIKNKSPLDIQGIVGDICLFLFAATLLVLSVGAYCFLWYVSWWMMHSTDSFGQFGGYVVAFMLWIVSLMELVDCLAK